MEYGQIILAGSPTLGKAIGPSTQIEVFDPVTGILIDRYTPTLFMLVVSFDAQAFPLLNTRCPDGVMRTIESASDDETLAGGSTTRPPSQRAVKAYVDAHSGGATGTDGLANESGVDGETTSDALDTLKAADTALAASVSALTPRPTSFPAGTANSTTPELNKRTEYTATGGIVAAIPAGATWVEFIGGGAGGGGASGGINSATTGHAGGGGSGGAGGREIYSLAELGLTAGSDSIDVNIGAGGAGAAGPTGPHNTAGSDGTAGGDTTFVRHGGSTLLTFSGGRAGRASAAGSSSAYGAGGASRTFRGQRSGVGGNGRSQTSTSVYPRPGGKSYWGGGGGGGGGASSENGYDGGLGGTDATGDDLFTNSSVDYGGGAAGGAGTGASATTPSAGPDGIRRGGSGGAGGAGGNDTTASAGGNGIRSGGGGGGGGVRNATTDRTAGAGGNGGDGYGYLAFW